MRTGSCIAFLIRASGADYIDGEYVPGVFRNWLLRIAKHIDLEEVMHFQVPNPIGRNDLTRFDWARRGLQPLVKSRELMVWRV
jgi:hypothetical protein